MSEKVESFIEDLHTMTGLPLAEAVNKMKQMLPPEAYTKVPGAAKLTEINPAYLIESATKFFGPCGFGWVYAYDQDNIHCELEKRTKYDGTEYETWAASVDRLELRIAVQTEHDYELQFSYPILSNGGADNTVRHYAIRGAVTNALGAAFAKLQWQLPVYQGKITHENAKNIWAKWQKKLAEEGVESEAPAEEELPQADPEAVTEEPEAEEKKPAASKRKPAAKKEEPQAEEPKEELNVTEETIQWAQEQVITEDTGAPMSGKTLGVAQNDPVLGDYLLDYISGVKAKANGQKYEPDTPEGKSLQKAAKILVAAKNAE